MRRKLLKKWLFWNSLQTALFILYLRWDAYKRERSAARSARQIDVLLKKSEQLRDLYPTSEEPDA